MPKPTVDEFRSHPSIYSTDSTVVIGLHGCEGFMADIADMQKWIGLKQELAASHSPSSARGHTPKFKRSSGFRRQADFQPSIPMRDSAGSEIGISIPTLLAMPTRVCGLPHTLLNAVQRMPLVQMRYATVHRNSLCDIVTGKTHSYHDSLERERCYLTKCELRNIIHTPRQPTEKVNLPRAVLSDCPGYTHLA